MRDVSPTARALLVLELLQDLPGITAARLAERLGVSERATRRYVAILREAGVPVESTRGPYGGYRVGRGLRLPPLMFTTPEALALVMAVAEGRRGGVADKADPVESALGKIIRVLPAPAAAPAGALRSVTARRPAPGLDAPSPEVTAILVQASESRSRVRLDYQLSPIKHRVIEIDPWAVVVRHRSWYLLGWSHCADARRVLRIDRISGAEPLDHSFVPPEDLDPVQTLEEHLSEGWKYDVEVVFDAPLADVTRWIPRKLGGLSAIDAEHTRLQGSTNQVEWYAEKLAAADAPFRIIGPPELRVAALVLGRRLLASAE